MNVCAISSKQCWRGPEGRWFSSGGFPLQMAAIATLFDRMTLVVLEVEARAGGSPLPGRATVVPLQRPAGQGWQRKLAILLSLRYYTHALRRAIADADVVHTPIPGDIPLLGMVIALLSRKRLIARYGSSWFPTAETTFMNRVTRGLMRGVAGGRNVMLATGATDGGEPAPDMHWLFASAISADEVGTVRPNVQRQCFDPVRLIYPGRLSSEKGMADLVEAFGLMRRDRVSATLTIAGEGPLRGWMEARLRALGCTEAVRFAGLLDRRGLLNELMSADVCILPSLTESFCKARLDAMLCGVPVLTTEVGFGRAIVGEDGERGWIVPIGDPAAISSAVSRLRSEVSDWPALRGRCRVYASRFTLEGWAEQIAEICAEQWEISIRDGKLIA
jgi:glycosyltransferase involved in cell wall biosynthesis